MISGDKKNGKLRPLLCWDAVFGMFMKDDISTDVIHLREISKNGKWQQDFNFEELIKNFDAIVLTDKDKRIKWVSSGFNKMTGYQFTEIRGKTPKLLQGENTCKQTTERMNKSLKELKPVKDVVVNYMKNGKEYACYIEIYPIFNQTAEFVNFIAFEREEKIR